MPHLRIGSGRGAHPTPAAGSDSLLTDLVEWFSMDEASGNRTGSYASIVLTDNNTVTSTAGKVSNCAKFVSANSESLSSNSTSFDFAGDIYLTISLWVYVEDISAERPVMMQDTAPDRFLLSYYPAWTDFYFQVSEAAYVRTTNEGAITAQTWYHLLLEHDPDNDLIKIRVNDGTPSTAAHAAGLAGGSGATLYLGDSHGVYFWGQLDEVAFWTRELTAAEITRLASGIGYPG